MAQLDSRIKLASCVLDSDKDPDKFVQWARHTESMVASTAHGKPLVRFIDRALGRTPSAVCSIPAWQHDAMYASDSDEEGEFEEAEEALEEEATPETRSASSGPATRSKSKGKGKGEGSSLSQTTRVSLEYEYTNYKDIPPASKELDISMYPILKQSIKGHWGNVLDYVRRPRYTYGMVQLWKFYEMSSFQQKTSAMEKLRDLHYDKRMSPKKFHTTFISIVTEVYNAKCTTEDFIMMGLMDAFKEHKKEIRYDIVKAINANEINRDNLYDMSQKFMSNLETLEGDIQDEEARFKQAEVNRISNKNKHRGKGNNCDRCGRNNHKTKDCFAKVDIDGRKLKPDSPWWRSKAEAEQSDSSDDKASTDEDTEGEQLERDIKELEGKLAKAKKTKESKTPKDKRASSNKAKKSELKEEEEEDPEQWGKVIEQLSELTKAIKEMS